MSPYTMESEHLKSGHDSYKVGPLPIITGFIKGSLDAKLPSYELLKMLKVIDS